MLHTTGERTLEKYAIFPYIAWAIFIGFAIFLYSLVQQLQAATESLVMTGANIDEQVQSNVERIEALEAVLRNPTE